jgi:hypothetical protein
VQWFILFFLNTWESPPFLGDLGRQCSENDKKNIISAVLAYFLALFENSNLSGQFQKYLPVFRETNPIYL